VLQFALLILSRKGVMQPHVPQSLFDFVEFYDTLGIMRDAQSAPAKSCFTLHVNCPGKGLCAQK
jgi:hypothetical protein